ncbi:MAG: hypothetical protein ACNA7M_11815 [Roseovarius sp.]
MNVNQMINMVVRMIVQMVMRNGMNAVNKRMSGGGSAPDTQKTVSRDRQAMKTGRKTDLF